MVQAIPGIFQRTNATYTVLNCQAGGEQDKTQSTYDRY